MNSVLLAVQQLASDDYTGFTFFVGTMAMMAASVFFFLSISTVEGKWKTSLLVSGLITFIAAVHYYYMRDYWGTFGESPTFFRYVDWVLTVPLMCVEFYLILRAAGAKTGLLWKLIIASVGMLVTGYVGEAIHRYDSVSWVWGAISGLFYFYIVYLVWFGEAKQLANASSPAVQRAHNVLCWFVLVGWAIYPIGYILGTAGGLFGAQISADLDAAAGAMNVIYNIGDAINKIGFGLVIYTLATTMSNQGAATKAA
jgi:sensory rhodopsin